MEVAANRALKVGELHYGNRAVRIAGGWRILEVQLGAVFRQRVLAHIVQFAAK